MHPALRRVDPAGRDFDDLEPGLLRAVEDLDIEAEAARLQLREDPVRDFGREGLEAALRISHTAEHEDSHQPVEDLAHRLPIPGLVEFHL